MTDVRSGLGYCVGHFKKGANMESKFALGSNIFVYGTLRPGNRAYDFLIGKTRLLVEETTLSGAELYDLVGFPGLKLVKSQTKIVVGDVLEITNDKLPDRLDQYEGYPRLYQRKEVFLNCGLPAWVYVFNYNITTEKLIPSGDWNQHKGNISKVA